ncbi:MAG: OmpA family protein [Ignavibacteria bacterium]|nr:OmpA family protein [Ignavibacteria bacterium]
MCLFLLPISGTAQQSKNSLQADIPKIQCKVRLPNTINSHRPTLQPVLTPDGSRLYFDRKNHQSNVGALHDCDDIWYSDRNSDGSWSEPVNIGPPLNTTGCDVLLSISHDATTALVGGVYPDDPNNNKKPGFSITTWNGTTWLKPKQLNIPNFYNNSGYFCACLSADNNVLIFAISRNDALGGLDLYSSLKDRNGNWSEPKTLGPIVNSVQFDSSPFLASDGKTLYFSSNRKGGYGKNDLYVTRRLDSTWQNWTKPKNLGEIINSIGDELSISINASGDTACIVSSDSIYQLEGIYFVCLPRDLRPQVMDFVHPMQNDMKNDKSLFTIYFNSNVSTLTDNNNQVLDKIISEHIRIKKIQVTGYTDDTGSDSDNMELSRRRAATVRTYLRKNGINRVELHYKGERGLHGKSYSESEKELRRRVDITVQYSD